MGIKKNDRNSRELEFQTKNPKKNEEILRVEKEKSSEKVQLMMDELIENKMWEYICNEKTFGKVLKLRIEIEKTKQEKYRLESINKKIKVIDKIMNGKYSMNVVGSLFGNEKKEYESKINHLKMDSPIELNQFPAKQSPVFDAMGKLKTKIVLPDPCVSGIKQSHSLPLYLGRLELNSKMDKEQEILNHEDNLLYKDNNNKSNVPPINYKFGGECSTPYKHDEMSGSLNSFFENKETKEPEKNVAPNCSNKDLMNLSFMKKRSRVMIMHDRRYSMPIEYSLANHQRMKNSKSECMNQDPLFLLLPNMNNVRLKNIVLNGNLDAFKNSSKLMSSIVPTIQKIPDFEPSIKKTKQIKSISQDTIKSFQNMIQFCHWKPENQTTNTDIRLNKLNSNQVETKKYLLFENNCN